MLAPKSGRSLLSQHVRNDGGAHGPLKCFADLTPSPENSRIQRGICWAHLSEEFRSRPVWQEAVFTSVSEECPWPWEGLKVAEKWNERKVKVGTFFYQDGDWYIYIWINFFSLDINPQKNSSLMHAGHWANICQKLGRPLTSFGTLICHCHGRLYCLSC